MSTKFTPGPWVFGNTSQHERIVIGRGGEGDYICHVTIQQRGGGIIAEAMEGARRANASLIAAAPDIYAALVTARQQLAFAVIAHSDGMFTDETVGEHNGVAAIDAALVKARGEA